MHAEKKKRAGFKNAPICCSVSISSSIFGEPGWEPVDTPDGSFRFPPPFISLLGVVVDAERKRAKNCTHVASVGCRMDVSVDKDSREDANVK